MKQKIQIFLILVIIVAAIRVAWIFYERHEDSTISQKQQAAIDPDFYVHPQKIFPYDLKSAKAEITKQPIWVKVGYAYAYFPYNPRSRRVDFEHEAGKLLPLQRLNVSDLVAGTSQKDTSQKQLLAVFDDGGKQYATAVGTEKDGFYSFWVNDMLFFEDPHGLYNHWPGDVWQAIDQHQAKSGMNEIQADFALGLGLLESGSDSTDRTLNYPNGGKPVRISFHNGKAVDVKVGAGG
jgi:hypothetical protein